MQNLQKLLQFLVQSRLEFVLIGGRCRLISIDDLIKSKRSLGRRRDLIVVEELEMIKNEKQSS